MERKRSSLATFVALACLVALPAVAHAQSAIAGIVKDASGAVLPGVTVEAASPALIEQSKSVATDGSGGYRIIDLRPGVYTVTFTLTGFQTVKHENIELSNAFTATVNADMKVGAIEETITVAGETPIVDISQAAHVQTMDRDVIDNLPTGKTIQGLAQVVIGINLSLPDVGGSRAAQQTYMSAHGLGPQQNSVMVDGIAQNSIESNGQMQAYYNDAMIEEASYQTGGVGADRPGGGVALNMIPREGGNRLSGGTSSSYRPGQWQGDNLTDRLMSLGVQQTNSTEYISDFTISQGGPLRQNQLWFFASASQYNTNNRIANTFTDDGRQGVDENYVRHGLVRLTWQISPRNKLGAYYDRTSKYRGHDMQSLVDPESASVVWTFPNYGMGQVKYTSAVSSRLLIEAGFAFNKSFRDTLAQNGHSFPRNSAGWFAGASRTTQTAGPRNTAPAQEQRQWKTKNVMMASMSYVTGTHHVKVGLGFENGWFWHRFFSNGDITQRYSSFTTDPATRNVTFVGPVDVLVRNTPIDSQERMNRDLSFYAQDSWRLRRLTLNAGLRFESVNSQVDRTVSPLGRFVPERVQNEVTGVPDWKDVAPRVQAIFDVFGTSRTAIKYSLNRYNRAQTTGIAEDFNTLASVTSAVRWVDANGDDIAQGFRTWNNGVPTNCVFGTPGCELDLSTLSSTFGILSEAGEYGGFPRGWVLEHGLELQHEVRRGLSVSGAWFHWDEHNLTKTVNTAWTSADFTPITIFNPIDGTPITYYNISQAAAARARADVTVVEPKRKRNYNGYFLEFRARPRPGMTVFGGLGVEQTLDVNCETSVANAIVDPNSIRFCDERENGEPFQKDFRLGVTVPLPYGITLSGVYLNNDEGSLDSNYTVSRTIRYPDGTASFRLAGGQPAPRCPDPCPAGQITAPGLTLASASVALTAPGTVLEERVKQVDLKVSKTFRFGRLSVAPGFEAFNVLNADTVSSRVSAAYASAAGTYRQPNSVLQGRILGVSANVKW
jgi:hypothetical protein